MCEPSISYNEFIKSLRSGFERGFSTSAHIRSIYISGSYALGDYIYGKSDLDLTVIVDGENAQHIQGRDLECLEAVLRPFDLSVDLSVRHIDELKAVSLGQTSRRAECFWRLRHASLRVFGADDIERMREPHFRLFLRETLYGPFFFMKRARELKSMPTKLDYPQKNSSGFGYLRTQGGNDLPTKNLHSILSRILVSLYCHREVRYISDGRAAAKFFRNKDPDQFSGISDAIVRLRDDWRYEVPLTDEKVTLFNEICRKTLFWENSYLAFVNSADLRS